jgi:hypothetical protein
MKMSLAAAIAVTVAAVGLPATASADPPVPAPPGSTCTFAGGLTTCVEQFGVVGVVVERINDPSCPSGLAERVTTTQTLVTTTTVFRGTHQLGEPRTESESTTSVTTNCV